METPTTPALDKYKAHWEDLLAEVEEAPKPVKLPASFFWMAIGYGLVGLFYGLGLVVLSPLFIPFLFAKQSFEQLEFPWRIKE